MSLSKLTAKCQACPKVDTCDHKEMEAHGLLPLPEQRGPSPQQAATGYQHIENFWTNQKLLIASTPGGAYPVTTSDEIHIDVDKLVRAIAREIQLPERLLRGDIS